LTHGLASPSSSNLLTGALPPTPWTTAWLRKMTIDIGGRRVCEWAGTVIEEEPIEHAIVTFANGGENF
jgi:hypothetical protein